MRDQTDRLRRHLAAEMQSGEEVLAGAGLSLRGSAEASMSGAATAGGDLPAFADGGHLPGAKDAAEQAGIGRGPHFYLVLTSQRLVVLKRSAFDRPKQSLLVVPLSQVSALTVSKQAQAVTVALADGRAFRFETPKAFKFLPPVYERLPALFREAKAAGQA